MEGGRVSCVRERITCARVNLQPYICLYALVCLCVRVSADHNVLRSNMASESNHPGRHSRAVCHLQGKGKQARAGWRLVGGRGEENVKGGGKREKGGGSRDLTASFIRMKRPC